jgi:hypothetical protein
LEELVQLERASCTDRLKCTSSPYTARPICAVLELTLQSEATMETRRDDLKAILQSIIKPSIKNMRRSEAVKAMNCSKDFAWRVKRAAEPPDRSINYYLNALAALGHDVTLLVHAPEHGREGRLRVAQWTESDRDRTTSARRS